MREGKTAADQDVEIGCVAEAEKAAREGDGREVLEFLKKAGKWTLLIGTTIGTSLATEMIMKANGTKA